MTEIEMPTQRGVDGQQQAWEGLEGRLAAYLGTMQHAADHLILEAPDTGGERTAPYAQVDVIRPGVLRSELSGNAVLERIHRLDKAGRKGVRRLGWEAPDAKHGFPNFHTQVEIRDADLLAQMITTALADQYRVTDPELLSYRAWGPAADDAEVLGLLATDEVPADRVPARRSTAVVPESREELLALVGETLAEMTGEEVERDADDDFVLDDGHRCYVRVRHDDTIDVFTRLVHDVGSRRLTSVELSILNRDTRWAKLYLADRSVLMSVTLPGSPYSAEHLRGLLPVFQQTALDLRDDLSLRTGGRIG